MKPLPLSFSALEKFKNCPKQYYEIKVAKSIKEEQGEAAIWGDYVHKHFEEYLRAGGIYDLPDNVKQYKDYLDAFLAQDGELLVEVELAVNTALQPCGFFEKGVFLRGYADVLRIKGDTAWVHDHKTGKRKITKQLRMMALLIFAIYPKIARIHASFGWLRDGKSDSETFTRLDWPDLVNDFLPDIRQYRDAFRDNVWQPRQSGLCHGWCPVTTCEFWKPKRHK